MNKYTVVLLLASALLTACAKSPDAIAPVSMAGAYDRTSCQQAAGLLAQEKATLAALEIEQRNAATIDAISVVFILIPTSGLAETDKAGEIGASKGKVNALKARLLSCR